MFLIEFKVNQFMDAERINFISLNNGKVIFLLSGDNESVFTVDKDLEGMFLNNISALNANPTNLTLRHHHINNPSTKY